MPLSRFLSLLKAAFRTGWQWGDWAGAEAASREYTLGVLKGPQCLKEEKPSAHLCPTTALVADINLQ